MMREILFRGKRADNGEWIYGYVNQHRGEPILDCMCEQINSDDFYIYDYAAKIDTGIYGLLYKIIPETVGQYTGLTDKNGVRIFEGDILKSTIKIIDCDDEGISISHYDKEYTGIVEFEKDGFMIVHKSGTWASSFYGHENYVIGNIHDNPELLDREE